MTSLLKPIMIGILGCSLVACGGGGGGGGKSGSSKPLSSSVSSSNSVAISSSISSSSPVVSSSTEALSSSISSESSSTASSTENSSIAASSSSTSANVLTIDMTNGWRGNSSGSAGNSGVNYNSDGVSFSASGDGVGAVFDFLKPTQLENAVIEMVVNVSSEFKSSGANLQIFAQIKNDWSKGEWNCLSDNSELTAGSDVTLYCTIDEPDDKFNQSANDIQMGIQAKGSATGTVTIKSTKITLAQSASSSSSSGSVYSANVDHLRDLANFPIGIAVSNTDSPTYNVLTNASERAIVEKHFNQMTAGNIMKMSYLHPNNNTGTISDYNFTNANAFVDYANTQSMTIHGHALVWHSDYQVPGFMKVANWSGTPAQFIAALEAHVTTIVDHFETKANVVSWDVVNEALTDGSPSNFRTTDSAFYVNSGNSPVYIEKAFQAARAANATVDLYYNDYNTEGNNAKTTKMMEMITDFQTRNIPINGVGFQMHVCLRHPSVTAIAASMQKVVDKGLKVKITELDVAVNQPYCDNYPANKISSFTMAVALEQKKRYCDIIKAYRDTVPDNLKGGITVWGTTDGATWLDSLYATQFNNEKISWPLLFDANYNDKPALRGFADALQSITCTNM